MLKKLKKGVSDSLLNLKGWKTRRKILVIESDDWGSIRMPSAEVYNTLLEDIRVDKCGYNKYDSLESESDLEILFETLSKFIDKKGNPAVITANFIMANPDFGKMKSRQPIEYQSESFLQTYQTYPNHKNSFDLVKKGIANKVMQPQCHGREHVNVMRWIKGLNDGLPETTKAFNHNLFGLSTTITTENRGSYMAAYEFSSDDEKADYSKIISEALQGFESAFGFKSKSFIAPNYCWNDEVENALAQHSVRQIQSGRVQVKSNGIKNEFVRHYTGEKNNLGQIYTVRNCHFEPSLKDKNRELALQTCLKEIENAFLFNRPAVICSHRLNFIGSIVPGNLETNARLLEKLLAMTLKKWPDVEFMSSDSLGDLILQN